MLPLTRRVLFFSIMLSAVLVCREGSSSTADVNSSAEANWTGLVTPRLDACTTNLADSDGGQWLLPESPYLMDWQSFIFADLKCLAVLPAGAARFSATSKEEIIEWLVCAALNN